MNTSLMYIHSLLCLSLYTDSPKTARVQWLYPAGLQGTAPVSSTPLLSSTWCTLVIPQIHRIHPPGLPYKACVILSLAKHTYVTFAHTSRLSFTSQLTPTQPPLPHCAPPSHLHSCSYTYTLYTNSTLHALHPCIHATVFTSFVQHHESSFR